MFTRTKMANQYFLTAQIVLFVKKKENNNKNKKQEKNKVNK